MKKRCLAIISMVLIASMFMIGCSKNGGDTVVNIGDTNNDNTKQKDISGDAARESYGKASIGNTTGGSTTEESSTDASATEATTEAIDPKLYESIYGTWTNNDMSVTFEEDGKYVSLTDYAANVNDIGTFDTDNKTFITISADQSKYLLTEEESDLLNAQLNALASGNEIVTGSENQALIATAETVSGGSISSDSISIDGILGKTHVDDSYTIVKLNPTDGLVLKKQDGTTITLNR